ncbi:DapH/DapD/GlmU-related protein [Dyadobacter sp. 3J3]|uniref:acyltransferase n=1 Tax=Dyadobacter sp. 3J3 TaxID=2606600 RepID=UPI00135C0F53|nr:acyltransferase [Dyadobacter sp. 3J3]
MRKVEYQSFPIIKGRIIIRNSGTIRLGLRTTFNCSINSNYVGLFKTCTIAVGKNAVLEIGDYSGFSGLSLYCSSKIHIGNYVNFGGNVCIWDTDFHPINYIKRRVNDQASICSKPIIIGDDVFVGANSIILKGVQIGDRSIIGAGSVVTKDIPPDQIWAGNPIKFIKNVN